MLAVVLHLDSVVESPPVEVVNVAPLETLDEVVKLLAKLRQQRASPELVGRASAVGGRRASAALLTSLPNFWDQGVLASTSIARRR